MADKPMEITDANFEEAILKADKPALVDFWAVWCGPCRVIGPIVEELADEYADRVVVGKLDVDSNRETAVKYGIQAIPTYFVLDADKKILAKPKDFEELKSMFETR